MAAADEEDEDGEGEEGATAPASGGPLAILAKLKANPIMLIGAGVAVLLVLGGGVFAFLGMGKPAPEGEEHKVAKPAVFFNLPDITVNLNTADKRAAFMKLSIALELGDKTTDHEIEPFMPRILDAFQVYLREVRPTDLEGSAGMFRLKEELERRINIAVYPARVEAVLFKQILVQ